MKHKLIKTDNYLLVVDDSEIKEGDFTYHHVKGIYNAVIDGAYINQKKIIAHLPLNNSPILEGVPLLPPIKQEDDVEKLANEYFTDINPKQSSYQNGLHIGFKAGFNKAREKYRYTQEDMRKAISHAYKQARPDTEYEPSPLFYQYPTEFECEMEATIVTDKDDNQILGTYQSKTITTAQGVQWVGKYK